MHEDTKKDIDIAAYLSQQVYKEKYFDTAKERETEIIIPGSDAKYKVIATSNIGSNKFDKRELIAYAVQNSETKEIYIVYRGTGDGKWIDNAIGLFQDKSPIQENAQKFYDNVIEKHVIGNPNPCRIVVTGHSKGGNLAQYVTMTSKYGELVNNCYSIDGQGFSQKAVEGFKARWGDQYNSQISKMYSVNGQNDYVDPLGIVIIPESRTFYVKDDGDKKSPFFTWHCIDNIMKDGTLNWDYTVDQDGHKLYNYNLEAGPVGELVKELSQKMMQLNDEELEDCAISIMYLLELGIGDVKQIAPDYRADASTEEMIGFFSVGVPIIVNLLVESDYTVDVLKEYGLSEDVQILVSEIQNYVKENNITDFASYISEDPLRLVEIYASMDLGKEVIHKAVVNVLSPENIAGFIKEHPIFSGVTVGALSVPVVREVLVTVASGIIAVGGIYLISKHVIANWDEIKADIIQGAEYVKDKVVEMYTALKNKLNEDLNNYAEDVLLNLERIITVGERFINKAVDQVSDFMGYLRDACKIAIKAAFFVSNPILYAIASKIYNASREPVRINMVKLRQCVNTMNRLASRVASIDSRLDNLYYQLSRNNIEQGEGIFTSLANMYNLFRADLNVDEGQAIKRKARALSELFEDCEKTDKWVTSNVPQRI